MAGSARTAGGPGRVASFARVGASAGAGRGWFAAAARTARRSEPAHAALRGAIGAMSMSGLRIATVGFGLLEQSPPAALGARAGTLLSRVPQERRLAVVELLHAGYGALGGIGFGVLPDSLRRRAWAGPTYGLALWAFFEKVLAPAVGAWRPPPRRYADRAALIADHLLYGLVLSELRSRPRR